MKPVWEAEKETVRDRDRGGDRKRKGESERQKETVRDRGSQVESYNDR